MHNSRDMAAHELDRLQVSTQFVFWHELDLPSLEQALDATPAGLTASEAAARLVKYGPNALPHAPPPTW